MENKTTNLADRIEMRPVDMPPDEEFLIELYYTTREDIHLAEIEEEQKRVLSLMQYKAQKEHYEAKFPDSKHDIILLDGKGIGRLWTTRYEKELLGIDLAILPEFRNLGIGTFLLQNLFDEAGQTGRVFRFHVMKMNTKAIRLYERLNCKYIESDALTHFKMERQPGDKLPGDKK
jgi:ribosomal protein S18 acetylase RimI-like enzyme